METETMTDKEVGELWRQRYAHEDAVTKLICKLAEERVKRYEETSHITRMVDPRGQALSEFDL